MAEVRPYDRAARLLGAPGALVPKRTAWLAESPEKRWNRPAVARTDGHMANPGLRGSGELGQAQVIDGGISPPRR